MKRRGLLALAVLCCLAASCSKSADSGDAKSADAAPATPVETATASKQTMHRLVTMQAVLYPRQQATIVPKISAPIARFLVQRGDHVKQGQLVAVLEHRDLAAAARESRELYIQAEATQANTQQAVLPEDLTKARADAQAAKEAFDAAQTVYTNRVELVRQGALAQKLADDAKVALVQAKSAYETARQRLQAIETVGDKEQSRSAAAQAAAAKAHYESAAAQVSYAEVTSPIAGAVADRPLNVGEVAGAGAALMTVVDLSRVVARGNVPVAQAAFLKVGDHATIAIAGADPIDATVTVVSPAVDPNTTTVQVWVEAANTDEALKPGGTVEVTIEADAIPDAVAIPAAALLSNEEGGDKVMVAGSDGLAHEHDVKVGVRDADKVQILEGVKPGDKVITQGGLGLDDKAKITTAAK